jgi:hypothetical protein
MIDIVIPQTLFQVPVTLVGTMATCMLALAYLSRVRLERPPIGVFNGRDVAVLYVFIVVLPALYIVLPQPALTTMLVITFSAALSIGYRPLLRPALLWPVIGVLLGINIWTARTLLGTVAGHQLLWLETSVVTMLAAVAVANLYVQGGMRLKHVAWFALVLGAYDVTFTIFIPFLGELADAFIGHPLNPAMGMRLGIYNVDIGLGDLLVYALFVIAARKAYGLPAARLAVGVVAVFGAVAPSVAPLAVEAVTRGNGNAVTPAQIFFGPPAVLTYLWLRRRYGPERTFGEYVADPTGKVQPRRQPALAAQPVSPAVPPAVVPEAEAART